MVTDLFVRLDALWAARRAESCPPAAEHDKWIPWIVSLAV